MNTENDTLILTALARRLAGSANVSEAVFAGAEAAAALFRPQQITVALQGAGPGAPLEVLQYACSPGSLQQQETTAEEFSRPLISAPTIQETKSGIKLAAPLGSGAAPVGVIEILGSGQSNYSADDLPRLRMIAVFTGDAVHRILVQNEPIRSPDAVTEENRLLRTLFNTLPDYLYVKDTDGRFVLANDALARSFGKTSADEIIGKDDSDFAPPHLLAQYRADESAVMRSGQPMIDREELVEEASGHKVWVHTTKVPLKDSQGRVIGLAGIGHAPREAEERANPIVFRRGTLAEAARKAGVSIATVSRAFNGSPLVTEDTRRRVFTAARDVGYAPNVAARSLSKGRTETVALVLKAAQLRGEFYTQLMAGFHWCMRERELDVLLSVVPEEMDSQGHVRNMVAAGACGAMAVHFEILEKADLQALESFPIPIIVVNYSPDPDEPMSRLTTVGFDNREGMKQAVRHLVALGHTKIGYLGGTPGHQDTIHREQGFRQVMAECLIPIDESWVVPCHYEADPPAGLTGMQHLLAQRTELPTAVVCASDVIAAGAVVGAKSWGQRVPGDISIIGFDDQSWSAVYDPPLTTIRHSGYDTGIAAGQALIALVDRRVPRPGRILLPTRLIIRDSTAPPRKQASG